MTRRIVDSQMILIVEDSDDDYEYLIRVFDKLDFKNPIYRCEGGQEALDYLYDDDSERPGVVLLDLNMPGIDGRKVLKRIKSDDNLKDIPVIVFTTSADGYDVEECYKSGANSYIQKPLDTERFLDVFRRLKEYWFETAILPDDIHH